MVFISLCWCHSIDVNMLTSLCYITLLMSLSWCNSANVTLLVFLLIKMYTIKQHMHSMHLKQDQNSTYRCAIWGLRIYNLLIHLAFKFEWHSNLSDIPVEWNSSLSDISIWVTFQIEWHSNLSDIPVWVTLQFEWHSIWVTFHFSDILF